MPKTLSDWDDFREEIQPYLDKVGKKEISIEEFDLIYQQKFKELNERVNNRPLELIGWLGGDYDYFGFYDDKEDAERGHLPTERFYDLLGEEYKGKKVKITVEIIE